ncbi:hypothetical protein G9A89_015883 [Geosiphon pyriformis]|nr:hypothetical protein G9A89_015883 [Geosiphon pyriformis]
MKQFTKRADKIIYPSSRKAVQLQRVFLRTERLQKKKIRHVTQPLVERIQWFRYALDESLPCATKSEIYDLIEMYISRNDCELDQLKSLHRNGQRPKAAREDMLEALKKKELAEFKNGLEIPDLMNPKNIKILREWDGDSNSLSQIKLTRIIAPNSNIESIVKEMENIVYIKK